MESSIVLSISNYLGINASVILIASDKHPLNSDDNWKWSLSKEKRFQYIKQCIESIISIKL